MILYFLRVDEFGSRMNIKHSFEIYYFLHSPNMSKDRQEKLQQAQLEKEAGVAV